MSSTPMIPDKYVIRTSREQVAGRRAITVRKFSTSIVLSLENVIDALKQSRLIFGNEFGVVKRYETEEAGDSVRALCGLVGERNLVLLNEQTNELDFLRIKHVLLATLMVEFTVGASGLEFLMYGGRQGRVELWNMLRENFGLEEEPLSRTFSDRSIRALCERFFDRLFEITFDPLNQTGWGTISAADFKSERGQYIRPEVDRMKQVRNNTDIVIRTFESELRNQTMEPLENSYDIRFRLLKDSGINFQIPELELPPNASDFEREMVVYDLAQQSYRQVVGTEELYEPLPSCETSGIEQLELL